MRESSMKGSAILQFRQEVERQLRDQIREAVEVALDEELAATLRSGRHERTDARRGYRHGTVERRLTTGAGVRVITVPRGRVVTGEGTTEFRSALLPRYARRTREVDEAILSCYLAGVNSRRIRAALQPLLGAAHLSKSGLLMLNSEVSPGSRNRSTAARTSSGTARGGASSLKRSSDPASSNGERRLLGRCAAAQNGPAC